MVVNEDTRGFLSVRGFIDNSICCCDCAWLRKATENGEVNRENINRSEKRPAAAGLFFDFSDNQSTTPYSLCYSACTAGKKESIALS